MEIVVNKSRYIFAPILRNLFKAAYIKISDEIINFISHEIIVRKRVKIQTKSEVHKVS